MWITIFQIKGFFRCKFILFICYSISPWKLKQKYINDIVITVNGHMDQDFQVGLCCLSNLLPNMWFSSWWATIRQTTIISTIMFESTSSHLTVTHSWGQMASSWWLHDAPYPPTFTIPIHPFSTAYVCNVMTVFLVKWASGKPQEHARDCEIWI